MDFVGFYIQPLHKGCTTWLYKEVIVISFKDYAESKHITYEAVRKQVKRYQLDLDKHIIKKDGKKYLDDFAIDYLDKKRISNPVVLERYEKDEERIRLENENQNLQYHVNCLIKFNDFLFSELEYLKGEKLKLERENDQIKTLLVDYQEKDEEKKEKTLLEKFFDFFKSLF